jgi:hypothetical protein
MESKVRRILPGLLVAAAGLPAAVVAIDGYHNNETKDPEHYRWEGTRNGGYSELGAVIQKLGGELRTVREPMGAKTLAGIDVLIIADPDTPAEATVNYGKGLVAALGDPWIYNEYINSRDNHRMAENLFRRLLHP